MTTQTAARGRAKKADGSWRWTETQTAYDSYGLPTQAKELGDVSIATDDVCTTTSYARNVSTTAYLVSFPSTVLQRSGTACTSGTRLGESRTYYDSLAALGAAPIKGLPTKQERLVSQGTSDVWATTEAGYDNNGRATSNKDARGQTTLTAFTPATGGPVLQTTVTNPLGHVAVTTTDGHRGLPISVTDPNGKTTTIAYDALGRLLSARMPGHPLSDPPDIEYVYTTSASGSSLTAKELGPNGNQIVSYQLFDGRVRLRQTQRPGPQANGGRIIADTVYDQRGLGVKSSTFWTTGGPSATRVGFLDTAVPTQTRTTFDNLERITADQLWSMGVMKWATTTAYPGTDQVAVTPPAGGVPTTTVSDALGRTVELRQHTGGSTASAYQASSYTYDASGQLTQATDPAGNRWMTTYDVGGRATNITDPDKGSATLSYNAAGDLTATSDARGVTLSYKYDNLGRKTELWQGPVDTGTKRASWDYDTLAGGGNVKGQLVKSTRWHPNSGGTLEAYSNEVTSYDDAYRPLETKVTLPSGTMGSLAGPWLSSTTYKPNGSVATQTLPAAGSLPAETVTYTYDNAGYPLTVASGLDTYVAATTYHNWGDVYQKTLGAGTKRVQVQTAIDEATHRLTENRVSTENQTTPNTWVAQLIEQYGYDDAGNVKNIKEVGSGSTTVSNQCFTYDPLRRLTEAWTTTAATCQAIPTQAVVGGPDPYWTSYQYNSIGNRTQDTVHTAGGNTVRSYTYPASGASSVRPHAITNVTAAGLNPGTDTYSYDNTGNATTRNLAGKPGQTLTWDPEGQLASVTDSSGTTSYVYTADGQRLLAYEPGTVTTLYIGPIELRRTTTGITCTRHYGVASRTTAGGLSWLAADHHGTGQLAINPTSLALTRRKTDPFGNVRGPAAAWPTTRGFVNGVQDSTGLVHLGVREYEPNAGRFVSLDPVMDLADPAHWNGYTYANSNPTTTSDPEGLAPLCGGPDGEQCHGTQPGGGDPCAPHGCYTEYERCDGRTPGVPDGGSCHMVGPSLGRPSSNYSGAGKQDLNQINGYYYLNGPDPAKLAAAADKYYFKYLEVTRNAYYATILAMLAACSQADVRCSIDFMSELATEYAPMDRALMGTVCDGMCETFLAAAADGGMAAAGGRVAVGRPGSCGRSFESETLVLMADGTTKPIKDIKVGDAVLATDPETGDTLAKEVTATFLHFDNDLTYVSVRIGEREATIQTTFNHPFWVMSEQAWVDATALQIGDDLLMSDGQVAAVVDVLDYVGARAMRDLTIADIHSFYVVVDGITILVHNDTDYGAPGYSNYVLVDKTGKVYYSGMFGPGETKADVEYRHSQSGKGTDGVRYSRANGDDIIIKSGTRTYGQARLMEQQLGEQYGTIWGGKGGDNWRRNRQNPMSPKKRGAYERYVNGCG
jgi:RHS repeat-associated protein